MPNSTKREQVFVLSSVFYWKAYAQDSSWADPFLLSVDISTDKWYVLFFITLAERCQSEWSNIYIIIQLVLTI